ncbi:MAG: nitrous oxide reductase accessory protein NosL [Hydrogenimonas sp.]|nr:nitrous oxide reductase accessory protein NosL [Hydrogenimonas sp.]
MKKFSVILTGLVAVMFIAGFGGCEKKEWRAPEKMHWDRDMCERCKMAVSDRSYAVQVVDPKTHKHYKFDDIGCAVLWFKEEGIDWADKAIIWVKDGKTGKWIDAKKAWYSTDGITPMGFGFTAFKNKADAGDGEVIDFNEVQRRILSRGR